MARKFDPETVAVNSADAYSAEAFEKVEWGKAAAMLADRGWTGRQAGAFLRSKATRWCRDAYSESDEGKAEYLERFLNEHPRDSAHCGAPLAAENAYRQGRK